MGISQPNSTQRIEDQTIFCRRTVTLGEGVGGPAWGVRITCHKLRTLKRTKAKDRERQSFPFNFYGAPRKGIAGWGAKGTEAVE